MFILFFRHFRNNNESKVHTDMTCPTMRIQHAIPRLNFYSNFHADYVIRLWYFHSIFMQFEKNNLVTEYRLGSD